MLLRRRHENKDEETENKPVEVEEVENVTNKEPKATPTKKPVPKKKVTKDDKSK